MAGEPECSVTERPEELSSASWSCCLEMRTKKEYQTHPVALKAVSRMHGRIIPAVVLASADLSGLDGRSTSVLPARGCAQGRPSGATRPFRLARAAVAAHGSAGRTVARMDSRRSLRTGFRRHQCARACRLGARSGAADQGAREAGGRCTLGHGGGCFCGPERHWRDRGSTPCTRLHCDPAPRDAGTCRSNSLCAREAGCPSVTGALQRGTLALVCNAFPQFAGSMRRSGTRPFSLVAADATRAFETSGKVDTRGDGRR